MTDFTDRQKEIIDASIKLIDEKGIQKLTIKNLSKIIGISEPAIYRHFENKMDILLGILTYFQQNNRILFEKTVTPDKSEIGKIESIFSRHFKLFAANPALAAVLFSEEIFQNDRRLSEKVFKIMNTNRAYLLEIIENGFAKNEFRGDIPKEQLSLIVMGSLRLIVTRWRLSRFEFDLEEEGKMLWNSLKKLIQKE